ncbi:hypothetical protein OG21DRAFT_1509315 [Imleria badia]|nr:hypothetical protein OG21DRAFT_1509315 [Imleria badia]
MLHNLEDTARIDFFNLMSGHGQTRSAAGWIFEEHIHHYLLSDKSLTIHWYDARIRSPQTLALPSLRLYTGDIKNVTTIPPSYWRPKGPNFPGIDGVIFTAECIYPIQATIRDDHPSPQAGVDMVWKSMSAETRRGLSCKFLFVGPYQDQIMSVADKHASTLTRKTGRQTKTPLPVGCAAVFPTSIIFKHWVRRTCH